MMNDEELLRYSRHILLPEIDVQGQQALRDSHVVIVGVGGLGCAAAMYLVASGIGKLTLFDDDVVDVSNLQRQLLYNDEHLGQRKVNIAKQQLQRINPHVDIVAINERCDEASLKGVMPANVLLDCSDNFSTRYRVNAVSVSAQVPLVSASAIRMEGQLSVYAGYEDASPCYACVFPETALPIEETCTTNGVLSPLVGVMGSMQAVETIKLLTQGMAHKCLLKNRLYVWNALTHYSQSVVLEKLSDCKVCMSV